MGNFSSACCTAGLTPNLCRIIRPTSRWLRCRTLDANLAYAAFQALDHRPKLLQRLLDEMGENAALTVDEALNNLNVEREKEHNFEGQWRDPPALQ
jgi:hypothetical protein